VSETETIERFLTAEKVDEWEIYSTRVEEHEVHLRNLDVEIVRGPLTNFGYAVRVFKRKKKKVGIGLSTGNALHPTAIRRSINTALVGAKITEFPGYTLPTPQRYASVKIADAQIIASPEGILADKVEEIISLLQESKTVSPTFGKVRTYKIMTKICNSEGVDAEKDESLFYLELALKAQKGGKLAEYWPSCFVRRVNDVNLVQQIPKWQQLAVDTLRARIPKTMKTTVIFTPEILGGLLPNTVGFHCLGSSVFKGVSRFQKGALVGSSALNISDDGVHDYALCSSPFDDEGVPQSTTTLVENGVISHFLYDAMYGTALNADPTGNGQKLPSSGLALSKVDIKYSLFPTTQPTNIAVEAGTMSLDELVSTTKKGIYVEQFSALESDPFTTSFGSEIRNAYLIEHGELSTPLKGGQISGFVLNQRGQSGENTPGLLNQVSGISKTVQMAPRCIAPHIRFRGVQVAGK
jgi:predicted Zn-dependent protease